MSSTTCKKFDEELKGIFPKAVVIRTRKISDVETYWAYIEFHIGNLSSDYDYLDFDKVDKMAKKIGFIREAFYSSSYLKMNEDAFQTIRGVARLTFSFHRREWITETSDEDSKD